MNAGFGADARGIGALASRARLAVTTAARLSGVVNSALTRFESSDLNSWSARTRAPTAAKSSAFASTRSSCSFPVVHGKSGLTRNASTGLPAASAASTSSRVMLRSPSPPSSRDGTQP